MAVAFTTFTESIQIGRNYRNNNNDSGEYQKKKMSRRRRSRDRNRSSGGRKGMERRRDKSRRKAPIGRSAAEGNRALNPEALGCLSALIGTPTAAKPPPIGSPLTPRIRC
ncbi:protein kinase superfamily protein [Striga asiatica]|uniref:Protein kinase superfamily protein n=1 Tax=Striga asiatica TaxID=4170 RepID=A0A5A7Q8G7_STRAF|nr:protein kinase superfamily protein [Striga asiatica]